MTPVRHFLLELFEQSLSLFFGVRNRSSRSLGGSHNDPPFTSSRGKGHAMSQKTPAKDVEQYDGYSSTDNQHAPQFFMMSDLDRDRLRVGNIFQDNISLKKIFLLTKAGIPCPSTHIRGHISIQKHQVRPVHAIVVSSMLDRIFSKMPCQAFPNM